MQNRKDNGASESSGQNVLNGLVNIIQKSLDRVSNLQAFVIAIGALIVVLILGLAMTPYLSNKLQTNSGIVYTALIIIFVLAILVIWNSFTAITPPKKHRKGRRQLMNREQEQYKILRKCMEQLTGPQFQEMINSLLKPETQDGLTVPLIKGSFLSDMQRWDKLDDVEAYLRNKFPEYFEELRNE